MLISPVPLDRVGAVLPRIRHWIARALDASPCDAWTLDMVESAVQRGTAALWVAHTDQAHGMCLTEIVPERSAVRIVMIAGERMPEWLPGLAMIEEWAKAWQCRVIEVPGRKGWERVLAPHGYAVSGGELKKVL